MANQENPTNKFVVTGQVTGVYPTKRQGLPDSYMLVFRTGYISKGQVVVSESKVFVNTTEKLPEVDDVLSVEGLLSIYNKKDEKTGKFDTSVSITETRREYKGKGNPRPQRQFNKKATRSGGGGYVNNQSRQRPPQEDVGIDEDSLTTIDF